MPSIAEIRSYLPRVRRLGLLADEPLHIYPDEAGWRLLLQGLRIVYFDDQRDVADPLVRIGMNRPDGTHKNDLFVGDLRSLAARTGPSELELASAMFDVQDQARKAIAEGDVVAARQWAEVWAACIRAAWPIPVELYTPEAFVVTIRSSVECALDLYILNIEPHEPIRLRRST